jgi:hypothetical protein
MVEELGNYKNVDPLLKLKGTLRSANGVPTAWTATGNPGGPGHSMVKARYIDPAPKGWQIISELDDLTKTTSQRLFIPSRITDNKKILQNDPTYLARLAQSGSPELVKAWLNGSFDVIDGGYFPEFTALRHVIRRFEPPKHWLRFRSYDDGSYYPFVCLWWTIASEEIKLGDKVIPRGSMICYKEWYGGSKPNVGLKLPAEDIGRGILERDGKDKITYGVADPSAFKSDGGPSKMERMRIATGGRVRFTHADNARTSRGDVPGGWDAVRGRLVGTPAHSLASETTEVLLPTIYFMDTCIHTIRTLPTLVHDEVNPEDAAGSDDHCSDAVRYGCMSRPWIPRGPEQPKPLIDVRGMSLNDLWAEADKLARKKVDWRV